MKIFAGLLVIALAMGIYPNSAQCMDRSNMRGERYGEVLLGKGGLVTPSEFDVYNTIGLNDCPDALWTKLDPEKIKSENGVKAVKLNGPRYWVIDGLTGSSLVSNVQRNFGGIEMRQAGTLKLTMKDILAMGKPYVVHCVARTTIWLFKAGSPVYQLISPSGEVFFMQSFSAQKEKQSMESLAQLGSKLSLPNGWKFRTLTLKKDYQVKALDGLAYVVQDDFENTYQKSTAKPTDDL